MSPDTTIWQSRLRAYRRQLGQSSDTAGLQSRFREAVEEWRVIQTEPRTRLPSTSTTWRHGQVDRVVRG
jgi:hypothetical protein